MSAHYETIIAVDPGASGAMALFVRGRADVVVDMPTVQERISGMWRTRPDVRGLSGIMGAMIERADTLPLLVLERVHATKRDGPSRAFAFGRYYESIRQCAACYRMDERTVPPNKWKQDLRLTNDKTQSLGRAREVFPSFELRLSRKKDDGRAEALLIGHWYLCFGEDYFDEDEVQAVS
jgi:crossover junction endodeoxyribonuclease RuvC